MSQTLWLSQQHLMYHSLATRVIIYSLWSIVHPSLSALPECNPTTHLGWVTWTDRRDVKRSCSSQRRGCCVHAAQSIYIMYTKQFTVTVCNLAERMWLTIPIEEKTSNVFTLSERNEKVRVHLWYLKLNWLFSFCIYNIPWPSSFAVIITDKQFPKV